MMNFPVFKRFLFQAKTTKKIVLRLECTDCKHRAQLALKRCKHFELGGQKKARVRGIEETLRFCEHMLIAFATPSRARWSSSRLEEGRRREKEFHSSFTFQLALACMTVLKFIVNFCRCEFLFD